MSRVRTSSSAPLFGLAERVADGASPPGRIASLGPRAAHRAASPARHAAGLAVDAVFGCGCAGGLRTDARAAAAGEVPARLARGTSGRLEPLACRGEFVRRLSRCGARLLRRPRGRQHQVVLGRPQGVVRRAREGADGGADGRAGAGVRGREGVPPLPRRAVREGQDAVQDPSGGVRRRRARDRLVRRGGAPRASGSAAAPTTRRVPSWR